MADVRALLKAKRQETRITHPYATYTVSEQLRCSICDTIIKYASAWEGHLGSKSHRLNVARLKQQEERGRSHSPHPQRHLQDPLSKRKADTQDGDVDPSSKKRRVESKSMASTPSGFPTDFFTDPTRRPSPEPNHTESLQDELLAEPSATLTSRHDSKLNEEYEQFQREMLEGVAVPPISTYEYATVVAEPELFDTDQDARNVFDDPSQPAADTSSSTRDESQRRAQDEKELIMDRLLEEERAQEEADTKVSLLKARLDAVKKMREAKRAGKLGKKS